MHSYNLLCTCSAHPSYDMMVRNVQIAMSDCTVNLTLSELKKPPHNLLCSSMLLKRNSFHCRSPLVESMLPLSL